MKFILYIFLFSFLFCYSMENTTNLHNEVSDQKRLLQELQNWAENTTIVLSMSGIIMDQQTEDIKQLMDNLGRLCLSMRILQDGQNNVLQLINTMQAIQDEKFQNICHRLVGMHERLQQCELKINSIQSNQKTNDIREVYKN